MDLSSYPYSTDLNFNENGLDDSDALELAKFVANNPYLKRLNIMDNNIGNKGAKYIAKALSYNNVLEELYFSFNNFGKPGLLAFAKMLKKNSTLKVLKIIPDGSVDYETLTEFVKYLKNNTTLIDLKLEPVLKDERIERLLERNRTTDWKKVSHEIIDISSSLYPRELPPYVVLEIIDHLPGYSDLPHGKKIKLIQDVQNTLRKI